MALRIACDLDGTLADMERALQREAERLFGPDIDLAVRKAGVADAADDEEMDSRAPISEETLRLKADATSDRVEANATFIGADGVRKRSLTGRQMRQLWSHVRRFDNFWMTLEEIEPGAVARLAALASLHGWEVIFLTQRPPTAGDTAQAQSQRWLAAHGFEFPSVYVMSGSRGRVADALRLDAVSDDRYENCVDVAADSKARPILIARRDLPDNPSGASSLGITVVRSFAEALEILLQLTAQRGATRSLINRVRAAIGI